LWAVEINTSPSASVCSLNLPLPILYGKRLLVEVAARITHMFGTVNWAFVKAPASPDVLHQLSSVYFVLPNITDYEFPSEGFTIRTHRHP